MPSFIFLYALMAACSTTTPSQEDVDFYAGRCPGLTAAQIADGWLSLFDGSTLYGWRKEGVAGWQVVDGAIHVDSGKIELLRTAVQFDDFELKLEFKAPPETNSGIFIRTKPRPTTATDGCIEINIAPEATHPFPTGSIAGRQKASGVELRAGFNSMTIRAVGDTIHVDVNSKRVTEFTSSSLLRRGYIGLQHNSGKVQFRNIAIRPLGLNSMFNGRDLKGWNTEQKLASEFLVEHGTLNMKNGRGQLESVNQFANFVFSSHVRTNAKGLNSGVFFRCIPGEMMNGYESQIQNQFSDDDRTKPKDCGSGGIFRRLPARIVNASDNKWFAKTIVADGGTMCVWINGLLVADWTDTRKPHANPRKGRRLEKGTVILQGHDPTTDLSFKEMRIRELKPRK